MRFDFWIFELSGFESSIVLSFSIAHYIQKYIIFLITLAEVESFLE